MYIPKHAFYIYFLCFKIAFELFFISSFNRCDYANENSQAILSSYAIYGFVKIQSKI